jgi:hypothetical protein
MKRFSVFILISLVIFPAHLSGQDTQTRHFQIDFNAIRLKAPFTEDTNVRQQFLALAVGFANRIHDNEHQYDEAFMSKMIQFISHNSSDKMALSAKYYFGEYLLYSRPNFEHNIDIRMVEMITEDTITLFESLVAEAPDSWQGQLASHYTREFFYTIWPDKTALLAARRKMVSTKLQIKDEPGFIELQRYKGFLDPIDAIMKAESIRLDLEEGNLAKAEAACAILKAKYPDTQTITRLGEQIRTVRQRHERKK